MRSWALFLAGVAPLLFVSTAGAAWGSKKEPDVVGFTKKTVTKVKAISEPSTAVTSVSPITPASLSIPGYEERVTEDGYKFYTVGSRIDIARNIAPGEKLFLLFSGRQGEDAYYHIWKKTIPASVDGGLIKITADQNNDYDPIAAREGRQVFFSSKRHGARTVLWRANTTGIGGVTKITGSDAGDDYGLDISPDGKRLLFTSQTWKDKGPEHMLWVVNSNGTELTQLRLGKSPRWSPDGKKILFDYANQIWLMDVDGSETTQLTSRGGAQAYWSPDGSEIVFASNPGGEDKPNWDIWKMRADGSELTQLTLSEGIDLAPVWSPSNEIYWLSNRGQAKEQDFRVWKMALRAESPESDSAVAESGKKN